MLARTMLVLFVLPPLAAAQEVKEVLANFKQGSKERLKVCKQATADAASDLDDALAIFEVEFDDLAGSLDPVAELAAAVSSFAEVTQSARHTAQLDISVLAGDALLLLTVGDADADIWPKGFKCGDGGALDDLLAEADQIVDKAVAAANKKLRKMADKLRKQTDMRLSARVFRGESGVHAPFAEGSAFCAEHALVMEVLVAFNRGGVVGDGRLWVGGYAEEQETLVQVDAIGVEIEGSSVLPNLGTKRWFLDLGVNLDEGNYVVMATQEDGSETGRSVCLP